jgi:hypothetical protein
MNSKEKNSRNAMRLLSVVVVAAVFTFTDDEHEQPDAATYTVRDPGPQAAPDVIFAGMETSVDDHYDANEDPLLLSQLF